MLEIRDGKKILTTPVSEEDLKDIHIGDIVYLNGSMTTCRDVAHRRLVEEGRELPVDVRNAAIFHAGPIIRPLENDKFEMVSVGPTTSMRMEKFEKEFVEKTGVKVIIGKGGMGPNTEYACKNYKAIHCVFPAGNAVVAATEVEEIVRAEWRDLGMPETLWNCRVKEFGPLIVSIDTEGRNMFEENKVILVLTLLAMIFEKKIGIKLCISGCIGALALILTGVISEKDALKSIDLKTIFLFGGTLSLASALSGTGAGLMIAETVMKALGENPSPYVLTFVVFILCCIMTNFMSNTATTALMAPICLSIAEGMGADPRAVLMACVIGGSCAYATPIGMPANTMVVGAGGYTFMDYVKAGLPLIVIATIVSMIILPIAFPFFP